MVCTKCFLLAVILVKDAEDGRRFAKTSWLHLHGETSAFVGTSFRLLLLLRRICQQLYTVSRYSVVGGDMVYYVICHEYGHVFSPAPRASSLRSIPVGEPLGF